MAARQGQAVWGATALHQRRVDWGAAATRGLITQARVPTSTLTFSNTPTDQEQIIHSGVGIACNHAWPSRGHGGPWMMELGRFHTKLASR